MSLLRKFFHEVVGKSSDAKRASKDGSAKDAGKATSPGGLINPFADDGKSKAADDGKGASGGTGPGSGRLLNPFAEDKPTSQAPAGKGKKGAAPAQAEDPIAQARKLSKQADDFYKKGQYDKAAETYQSAYQLAPADHRGPTAFNIAQSYRLGDNLPAAAAWYQKALVLGGPGLEPYRKEIEQDLDEMLGKVETGPDGEELGEAKILFEEAEIAYAEHDYAKAEVFYRKAYADVKKPSMCFNIAQACRLEGKNAEAEKWYEEYLRQVPDSPYKAEVEKHIEDLKKKAPDPKK